MASSAHGDPDPGRAPSPYIMEFPDYQNNVIRITINYNDATGSITGGSVFRDGACVYHKILVGLGGDGSPDSTTHKFNVPAGTTVLNKNAFVVSGFDTIEEFWALQITAGP